MLIDRRWRGDFDGSMCMLPDGMSIPQLLLRALCQMGVDILLAAGALLKTQDDGLTQPAEAERLRATRATRRHAVHRRPSLESAEDAVLLALWLSELTTRWIAGGPQPAHAHALVDCAFVRSHARVDALCDLGSQVTTPSRISSVPRH